LRKLILVIGALSWVASLAIVSPVGAVAAGAPAAPLAPGSINCDGGFHTVASPNGLGANFLIGTSVLSATDIWSVGDTTSATGFDQTLAEHWDGTNWTVVPTPNLGAFDNDLNGVVAISTNDVWAVGDYATNSSATALVATAQHWNGSAWTSYAFAYSSFTTLLAVTAVSSNDVWAVGTYTNPGNLTLIEHWNGSAWSKVPSVDPGTLDSQLFAVSAWSSTDVWAVGHQQSNIANSPVQSLAEHWNGSAWSAITTPNTALGDNEIFGVTALEAGHAVGVGYGNYVANTLTPKRSEGWDLVVGGGSTNNISIGGSSLDAPNNNAMQEVGRSGAAVWAVGYTRPDLTQTAPHQNVVIPATWDATAHTLTWSPVGTAANPDPKNDILFSVAAVSPYEFWAVGNQTTVSNVEQTLTEYYCPIHFTVTAPVAITAGSPLSFTVTAEQGDGTTSTAYRGTVHFTSSDSAAVLPANYTFTPGDSGSHTFSGTVFNTPGNQSITATDSVMPITFPGSATVIVACGPGVCPGPGGTPGTRPANPGPPGTSRPRDPVNQSGAVGPGPRLPSIRSVAALDTAPIMSAPAASALPARPQFGGATIIQ
jgi:hypothetical protein